MMMIFGQPLLHQYTGYNFETLCANRIEVILSKGFGCMAIGSLIPEKLTKMGIPQNYCSIF
jgi:hypothetical protein